MPGVTFDTSIFIDRKKKPAKPPAGFLMSVVVIQEIIAGADDGLEVKKWQATMKEYQKEGRLLVPAAEDWCEAGRVLNSLLRGLKSKLCDAQGHYWSQTIQKTSNGLSVSVMCGL